MVNLYKNGVYLVNGTELLEDRPNIGVLLKQRTGKSVSQSEAEKETIAYRILEAHNLSGNMEHLRIQRCV